MVGEHFGDYARGYKDGYDRCQEEFKKRVIIFQNDYPLEPEALIDPAELIRMETEKMAYDVGKAIIDNGFYESETCDFGFGTRHRYRIIVLRPKE